jgi:hypothetical protein
MAIRTGIGVGAAQIADTSGIMNAYARQIAQQQRAQAAQAQREFLSAEKEKERAERAAAKFDEDLADIMASAKLGGIRDVDVPEITKAYNEVKDFYSKSGSLKDSQKPLFRAELRNRMNTINDAAINSKEVEKKRYATAAKVSENPWDYDPKVIQDLDYVNKTPLSKLGALANMDPLNYQKLPNFGLIDNIYKDSYEIGKKNSKFVKELTENGKRRNLSSISEDEAKDNLIQRFNNLPEAKRAISYRYSKQFGKQPTNEELTNYIMDEYKSSYGLDYLGEIKDLKEPKSGGGEDQDKYTYRQQVITGALQNDKDSINKIKAALPEGTTIERYESYPTAKSKGGFKSLKITIPQGIDAKGNPLPKLEQTIEASRGEGVIKLNRILNTYTGENISDSKLGIKGGKLAGQQIEVNIPKSAPQQTKNKVKGTYAGLDKDGNPIFK